MFKGCTGFQRFNLFDKELLDGRLEEDEFQAVIDDASKISQLLYSQKRLADNKGI